MKTILIQETLKSRFNVALQLNEFVSSFKYFTGRENLSDREVNQPTLIVEATSAPYIHM